MKSLAGEPLTEAELEADGMFGDRRFGIRDDATGKILTGRREPSLLLASSRLRADCRVELTLPDGLVVVGQGPSSDAALSRWLGRPVSLVDARRDRFGEAEAFTDPLDDSSQMSSWAMPEGRYVDAFPLLVVTTATIRQGALLHPGGNWDPRRFRPSILVEVLADGWIEDEWCGRILSVGEAQLEPLARCVRCTVVTRPQNGLDRDLDVYRALVRHHGATLGVGARVRTPGTVRVGDCVELGDP